MINKTKMMEQAKNSKTYNPLIEILIFFAIFIVSNIVQNIILVPALSSFMMNDQKLIDLMNSQLESFEPIVQRMLELMTIIPEWIWILRIFLYGILGLCVIVYSKFMGKRSCGSIGLRKHNAVKDFLLGTIFGGVLMIAVLFGCIITGSLKYESICSFSPTLLMLYFLGSVVYGISQELFYRGYYMTTLTKTFSVKYSLVMSAIVDAFFTLSISDGNIITLINSFLMSLMFGLIVIKRGNIWFSSAFHSIWYFSQIIFFGVTSGTTKILQLTVNEKMANLNGGVFGISGSLIFTLVIFLALGVVLRMKQNSDEIAKVSESDTDTEK